MLAGFLGCILIHVLNWVHIYSFQSNREHYMNYSRAFGKILNYLGAWYKELEVYVLFQDFLYTIFDPSSRDNSGVKINHLKADLSLLNRQSWGVLTEWSCHGTGLTVTFWNDCGCRTSCRQLLLALFNCTHFSVKHFPGCIKGVE